MTQQLDAEISSSLQISPVSRPIVSRLKNTLHDLFGLIGIAQYCGGKAQHISAMGFDIGE